MFHGTRVHTNLFTTAIPYSSGNNKHLLAWPAAQQLKGTTMIYEIDGLMHALRQKCIHKCGLCQHAWHGKSPLRGGSWGDPRPPEQGCWSRIPLPSWELSLRFSKGGAFRPPTLLMGQTTTKNMLLVISHLGRLTVVGMPIIWWSSSRQSTVAGLHAMTLHGVGVFTWLGHGAGCDGAQQSILLSLKWTGDPRPLPDSLL